MAQILISEPDPDVRRLLERMVSMLGHEPISVIVPAAQDLTDADVFIVEPFEPLGAVLAQAASIAVPELPLICASVAPPPSGLTELGVVFAACLLKPFDLDALGEAIEDALLLRLAGTSARCPTNRGGGDPWPGDRAA